MQVQKKFYNIEEMSSILGKTISSIYAHLARKQFDAVPMPIKLGRRLAWVVVSVDEWVERKVEAAEADALAYEERMKASVVRRRGRPRKGERRK